MPAPPCMVAARMIYRLIRTASADGIDTVTGPGSLPPKFGNITVSKLTLFATTLPLAPCNYFLLHPLLQSIKMLDYLFGAI